MGLSSQAFRNKGSRLRNVSKQRVFSIFRVSQHFGNSFPSPALLKRQNYPYHVSGWIKLIVVSVLSRSSDPLGSVRLPPSLVSLPAGARPASALRPSAAPAQPLLSSHWRRPPRPTQSRRGAAAAKQAGPPSATWKRRRGVEGPADRKSVV